MRLWTLKPSFLDSKGLGALWREGLLAKAVIEGKTSGYRSHPQLDRFYAHPDPRLAIEKYLWHVLMDARRRGYSFDASKLPLATTHDGSGPEKIVVTSGQVEYEARWLAAKLAARSGVGSPLYNAVLEASSAGDPAAMASPSFEVVVGPIAPWERTREAS